MTEIKYDNYVSPDNVFGHALELLARNAAVVEAGGVHLDIACGQGRIAEHVHARLGLHYVGIDIDESGVASLAERGYEGHVADAGAAEVLATLEQILGGRRLVSITCLDGLEHLAEGRYLLEAVGTLLAKHRAVAVFSVPNVTHLDVSVKNLLGEWTYTETGLLDATHVQLYSERSLEQAMSRAGLQRIDEYNVVMLESDQHFPADHVGLSSSSSFNRWIRKVRSTSDPHGMTNQFVWAVTAVPPRSIESESEVSAPFATVVMRTQGRRPQELREALLCLAGQTMMDFEVLIVLHRGSLENQRAVERIIEDQPPRLRQRARLLLLDHGHRAAPLNLALREARGRYITIFDDDDLVLGTWMERFVQADREAPGQILRAVSLCQDVRHFEVRGVTGVRADDSPRRIHNIDFLLSEHVLDNQSPTLSWMFPRSLYTDFGMQFDESMTTTEDWDFLLRAAEIAGVKDIGEATSIYQWWTDRESSKTMHKHEEWAANRAVVERHIDSSPILLPAGETRVLRRDQLRLKELEAQLIERTEQLKKAHRRVGFLEGKVSRLKAKNERMQTKLRRHQRLVQSLRRNGVLAGNKTERPRGRFSRLTAHRS